ncbi:uncharacterized protein LOC115440021 [Manduca sexta]|nr:uncharacterized protein LOC115440021 [Manduca sexta]
MSVPTLFVCLALSTTLVPARTFRIEDFLKSVTKAQTARTDINSKSNIVTSTEPYEEPTTYADENSTQVCLPGQSAYKKKDLESIIKVFYVQHDFEKLLNESYYLKALEVRDKYYDNLEIFEKRFEDRPQHLKHILEDMVATRRRIEPIAKRIASLLNQSEHFENSYRTTEEKVNKVLEHIEKSTKICNLNCGNGNLDIISLTSSRRSFKKLNQVYCSTFRELSKIIIDRLKKFQVEFSDILVGKINKDSIIFEEKIMNIKKKLKTAAVEQFGLTMYEILNLQDEYYHYSADLKEYNISNVLQDIKHNEYEINAKLLELESNAKKYRDYCISCNDRLVYPVMRTPKLLARTRESESLLDEVLNETTNNIQISINEQYAKIFEELNQQLDETTIIEVHLSKLKPIKVEIENEVKKEIDNFETLQRLVPKASIAKVHKLADESKELLRRVENGLEFTKRYIQ